MRVGCAASVPRDFPCAGRRHGDRRRDRGDDALLILRENAICPRVSYLLK
jgi:hypothetical protein